MSYGIKFDLEAWVKSAITLIFWIILFVPLIIMPLVFLTLPTIFGLAGITLGTPTAFQAVNIFLVALIDPIKGGPVIPLMISEVALPLGLPPAIMASIFVLVFLWENETGKVTVSKYPPIKAFKEVVVGNKSQPGILLLLPVFDNVKIPQVFGSIFESLENTKHKIAGKSGS